MAVVAVDAPVAVPPRFSGATPFRIASAQRPPQLPMPRALPAIEERMRASIAADHPFELSEETPDVARQHLVERDQPFKVEIVDDLRAASERDGTPMPPTTFYRQGPFIAATDYMKVVADQVRQWVPGRYVALGTDGFGRSDAREALRAHFEVDRRWIVVAALKALADDGRIDRSTVTLAIKKFGIDPAKPEPSES